MPNLCLHKRSFKIEQRVNGSCTEGSIILSFITLVDKKENNTIETFL